MFKINHSHFLKFVLLGFLLMLTLQPTKAQSHTDFAYQTVAMKRVIVSHEIDWNNTLIKSLMSITAKCYSILPINMFGPIVLSVHGCFPLAKQI